VCGYTKPGEESGCAWVFRKEFLGLDEVGEILRKLDMEKKGWDVDSKKRTHEFFIPNGSKILVSSYSQLRRDGVEKYVGDFNQMVREVFRVTGDVGIEVLPYVPVVMENMDRKGRECITGLVDWVEWVGRQKGRESIRELSKTGGSERGDERVEVSYVRQFASMKNRMWVAGLEGDWRGRGNRLDLEKGNRVEVELRMVEPPKGIGRLMRNEGRDTEEERVGRESVEHGISVEGEFAFASAIANFTRKAREEEYFHGERVRNVREQLGMRARVEGQGERRK
jgi:hypothetical protein